MTKNPNRVRPGVPEGGQFAATSHAEPGLTLETPAPAQLNLPKDPFLGRHARCPEPRPADWVFGKDECIDAAVGTVDDGPLSRGVVNAQRRIAFHAWDEWATERAFETKDPAYYDFLYGLRTGVAALYERRMDHYDPGMDRFGPFGTPAYTADHALQISGSKRTSAEDREHWRKLLKRTPSDAWHRGHLAAGLILSGAEGYWGLRDNPDAAVLGPVQPEPGENPRDDSNQIFDFEVQTDNGFATYSVDDLGGGNYALFAEDGTSIDFECNASSGDHHSIQDQAAAALKKRGIIDDDTWMS